ncbi:MAG: hypothetical protein AB1540_18135 [Bdellovibrionota bacterium]
MKFFRFRSLFLIPLLFSTLAILTPASGLASVCEDLFDRKISNLLEPLDLLLRTRLEPTADAEGFVLIDLRELYTAEIAESSLSNIRPGSRRVNVYLDREIADNSSIHGKLINAVIRRLNKAFPEEGPFDAGVSMVRYSEDGAGGTIWHPDPNYFTVIANIAGRGTLYLPGIRSLPADRSVLLPEELPQGYLLIFSGGSRRHSFKDILTLLHESNTGDRVLLLSLVGKGR